jgi:hypothetical protein
MFQKITLDSGARAAEYGDVADERFSFEQPYAILG